MFKKLELFIHTENPKMDKQKCHSTQQTNTLYQLQDKKDLTITTSVILKELHKKFGNIATEYYMKENTKQ